MSEGTFSGIIWLVNYMYIFTVTKWDGHDRVLSGILNICPTCEPIQIKIIGIPLSMFNFMT